ncbi:MAG TPA: Tol-Pal system beta propeller repeat protein TolB [Fibrobacteria bacterium]|nr:Tol-Pal system beta propeller repeat protein TolB [Fibrobacteria bacterium]
MHDTIGSTKRSGGAFPWRRAASAVAFAASAFPFASLACLAPAPAAAADVVITSENKGAESISLGFIDFICAKGDAKTIPFTPGGVISWDLEFSGRFKVRAASRFDSTSKGEFKADGALAYVRGEYTLEGDNFTLNCELIDIDTQERILGKKYSGKKGELRQSAHKFSDELTYQLFGEKGIAQSRIAYVNKRGGHKEISVMDYDGANVTEITKNKSINLMPCWVEGKSKILYTSYAGGQPQFYLKDFESGKNAVLFASKGMNTSPGWNKMDKEIVYASTMDGNTEIYRRPFPEGKAQRLTFFGSIETSPSWSPNGYEIVFISDRGGKPMVYVMDRDGSNMRALTHDGDYFGSPSWSPKGDRIAYTAMDEGNNMNIMTISPDGKDPAKLTAGSGSNENPSWSPDGRHIVFMSTRTGSPEIFMMNADGSDQKRISFSGGNYMPRWSDY